MAGMKPANIFSVMALASAVLLVVLAPQASAHPRPQTQSEIVLPPETTPQSPQTTEVYVPAVGIAPNKLNGVEALQRVEDEDDKYWLNAKQIMVKSTPELIAQHQEELGRGIHYAKIFEGNLGRKQVALTFDDGPHPAFTPQLLAVLQAYHAKATFFVVGEQAERYPNLIRAEVAAGDDVGNHTYDHVSLVKIPADYVGTEIKACGEVLDSITGKPAHLFRPPGGVYDSDIAQQSEALGYTMVLWTIDPGDYASPGDDVILDRTLGKITNGSIILLHDGIQQTIDVLPRILQFLKDHGYQTVTVDYMLHHQS